VDSLLEQIKVRLRGVLAAKGVPEAQLDATVAALQNGLKTNAAFTGQLVPLAQQLGDQLRQRFGRSPQAAAFDKGAWDE
jgi:hypothetical protein